MRGDSSLIRALIECDSLGRATIKRLLEYQGGDRLKPPEIGIDDCNVLTAKAQIDSTAIYLCLKDRYEKTTADRTQTIRETIEVNRLTGWQKLWIGIGWGLTGCLLIRLFKPKILTLWQKILKN